MLTIARSELAQILRNRAVLITSLLLPLAASAFFVYSRDSFVQLYSLGYIAAVIVFTIGALSLYSTIVTTLAARRQTLFLKRLLPGGSATEVVVDAWNGGLPVADALLLLAPTLAWVVVAIALATRLFRWEPRR